MKYGFDSTISFTLYVSSICFEFFSLFIFGRYYILDDIFYVKGINFMSQIIFYALQLVKQAILPRVHGLALKTTVAAVCMHYF